MQFIFYSEVRNFESVRISFEGKESVERVLVFENKIGRFFDIFKSGEDSLLPFVRLYKVPLVGKYVGCSVHVHFII
jgi:hypothetical protein